MKLPTIGGDREDIGAVALVLGQLSLGILIPAIICGALYVIARVWIDFGALPGLLFLAMGAGTAAVVLSVIAHPPLRSQGPPSNNQSRRDAASGTEDRKET